MAEIGPKKLKSKSGAEVIVRSAVERDAQPLMDMVRGVLEEEIYSLTSAAEYNMTVDKEEAWIESFLDKPNKILLVAEINSKIVGMLDFTNGHRNRIAHTGEFGMSVDKSSRDQGVGALLLGVLIDWATQHALIEKICLNVHASNERAIALYKKMGFEIEGLRKRDLKYAENKYIDTVVMGRFV